MKNNSQSQNLKWFLAGLMGQAIYPLYQTISQLPSSLALNIGFLILLVIAGMYFALSAFLNPR